MNRAVNVHYEVHYLLSSRFSFSFYFLQQKTNNEREVHYTPLFGPKIKRLTLAHVTVHFFLMWFTRPHLCGPLSFVEKIEKETTKTHLENLTSHNKNMKFICPSVAVRFSL